MRSFLRFILGEKYQNIKTSAGHVILQHPMADIQLALVFVRLRSFMTTYYGSSF